MASRTVRIRAQGHARLKQLAQRCGQSMAEVLEKAIASYERRVFLEGLNQDFAALRANTTAWKAELAERAQWETTSGDGLGREGY